MFYSLSFINHLSVLCEIFQSTYHMTLPSTHRALVYEQFNGPLEVQELPLPEIKDDEILVKIYYSGICHSDLHGWIGDWPELTTLPNIGGHEGAGEVVKIGKNVVNWELGNRAGVKVINNSCLFCEYCKKGFESNCTSRSFHGFIQDGTFQEYVAIRGFDAIKIPNTVDLAQAAPILCAGVTAYKALKESAVKPGEIMVITGAGGGLGSYGIQYAKALGMRVLAMDHPSKEEHCRALGAEWFVNGFNSEEIVKTVKELTGDGPHGVVNFSVNRLSMEQAVEYVRPRGTVVYVALPKDNKFTLDSNTVIFNALTIKGSLVGNRLDCDEALDFVARGLVKVPYRIVSIGDVQGVFEDMKEGRILSRCIVDLSK